MSLIICLKKSLKKKKVTYFLFISFINIYIVFFLVTVFFYLSSGISDNKHTFLFILSICISTDIGGYIFGKIFKGKKLTKISPNKTYAGFIGSLILSLLVSYTFFSNLNIDQNYLQVTIILSLVSQIGDLAISYLKRLAKIKDTGSFLPGHGGILDRIDGILLALPFGIILINI